MIEKIYTSDRGEMINCKTNSGENISLTFENSWIMERWTLNDNGSYLQLHKLRVTTVETEIIEANVD